MSHSTLPAPIVSDAVISIANMPAAPAPVVPTAIVFHVRVPLNTSPSMTGPST